MISVTRIKKTGQIVHPIGPAGSNHTLCLFPFTQTTTYTNGFKMRPAKRGAVQAVRNDNLKRDREDLF